MPLPFICAILFIDSMPPSYFEGVLGPVERLIVARISIKRPAEIQAKYEGHTSANHSVYGEDHKRCVGQRSFKL